MAYLITGKLIQKHRDAKRLTKAKLALMCGIEYRGFIDKLEDGSRKAPKEIVEKLLKFLEINIEDYAQALIEDARRDICEELGLLKSDTIEAEATKIEEDESWQDLI